VELIFWTSAFNSSHFVNMKTEDRTETIDSEQTREETVSLNHYLTFIKEKLALLNEIVVDEFKMSRNVLTAIKIGLFSQYIGITLLVYVILTSSLVLNGRIHCMASTEREFNDTERVILASLCRNPNYQSRFGGVFLFLETITMVLLLLKLVISVTKDNGKLSDYFNMRIDEKTLFWISFLPRSMLYLVLPLQSSMAANLSFQFSSLLSILRSPVMLLFSLTARIITLPMSILFPYPLKSTAEADISMFYKERSLSQDLSASKLSINCYENCNFSFDWSWCLCVLFFFLNFAIIYWFIGFTENLDEVADGRVIDSRENYSDGVEFIRVSEVSEDFSFEEEEENKVKDGGKSVKDVGVKAKKVDEDLVTADGMEKVSGDDNSSKSPQESLREQELSQGLSKGPLVSSQGSSTICEMTAESKVELKVIEGEGFIDPGLAAKDDLVLKSKEGEGIEGQDVLKHHISSQDKQAVKFKDESEVIKKERFRASSLGKLERREYSKEISQASKGTQTFSLKLNKGCQTFVPIHLHKKINKKTQVSPIFVDAQTNTGAVVVNGVSNAPEEEDVSQSEQGRFKHNIAVQENGGDPVTNLKTEDANESVKEERKQSENQSDDDLEKLENGRKSLEASPNSKVVTQTNGSDHREKFGFPELKIIPRTLDFERRIIRENQIERINLDAFLKCLEKEDDRDVIFVEKNLLLDSFKNIVSLTKALATEDAICPRSGDFADECNCCVHSLIKKCTKGELKSDEVDGLKMETEDDDYSDDESFFNGFRL